MNKAIRTIIAAACICSFAAALSACSQSTSAPSAADEASSPAEATETSTSAAAESSNQTLITEATGPYATGIHHATMTIEGYPAIEITLDADAAPVSTSNFCNLAEQGYYDGLALYRIVEDFCLQGGTLGNGSTGQDASLTPIIGEFANNGIDNPLAADFGRGSFAMARTQIMDSATSTFFICLSDDIRATTSLNDEYAAFGTIDEAGMETVDQIVADYLEYATDSAGCITDEAHMPFIDSIVITD